MQNKIIDINVGAAESGVPWLSRLYIWSVVLEPLLFFVLFENGISSVSRILQVLVLVLLSFKVLGSGVLLNPTKFIIRSGSLYGGYAIYFMLAIFAGLVGILSGAYSSPIGVGSANELQNLKEEIRPFTEYVILLYYFGYFVILPLYLINTERQIQYFFKVFKLMFVICIVVGLLDFCLANFDIFLVPRHIADWRMVGVRFHGLAGEPRHAFSYLFFGLAILHLRSHYKGENLSRLWMLIIVFSAMLTQSGSGILGIVFFIALYALFGVGKISVMKIAKLWMLLILIIGVLYVAIANSERLMGYLNAMSDLWVALESKGKIPYLMQVQMDSIAPLYDLTVKFRNGDFMPIIFGSGLGSASVLNNIYAPTDGGLNNPNSQIVRMLYETGLLGTYFFILAFIKPMKHITKHLPENKRRQFIMVILLLLGLEFALRSSTAYIYLGIIITIFRVMSTQNRVQHTN